MPLNWSIPLEEYLKNFFFKNEADCYKWPTETIKMRIGIVCLILWLVRPLPSKERPHFSDMAFIIGLNTIHSHVYTPAEGQQKKSKFSQRNLIISKKWKFLLTWLSVLNKGFFKFGTHRIPFTILICLPYYQPPNNNAYHNIVLCTTRTYISLQLLNHFTKT